jgi:hypothetical protein
VKHQWINSPRSFLDSRPSTLRICGLPWRKRSRQMTTLKRRGCLMLNMLGSNAPAWVSWAQWAAVVVGLIGAIGTSVAAWRKAVQVGTQLVELSGNLGVKLDGKVAVSRDIKAQHQVRVGTTVQLLTHEHVHASEAPLVSCEVRITNQHQRPVDLVTCLVAAREIDSWRRPGLGRNGRGLLWEDLLRSYWNQHQPGSLFSGLSTVANVFQARQHLVRLDPGEYDTLLRLDAVTDLDQFLRQQRIHLLYKLFSVVVVAEPGATLTNEQSARWQSLQYTLDTLGRAPFRLALHGAEQASRAQGKPQDLHARNPLNRLTSATGWRCFLLHHWDFEQEPGHAPKGAPDPFGGRRQQLHQSILAISDELARAYGPTGGLGNIPAGEFNDLGAYCYSQLQTDVDAWRGLLDTIDHCYERNVGWHNLIKEKDYKPRWDALVKEGYLAVADPGLPADADPYLLERFVTRIRYELTSVDAKELEQSLEEGADVQD